MAIAIRDRPELWEPLLVVDAHRRRYRLLFEDERTDIWVLCWMPGPVDGLPRPRRLRRRHRDRAAAWSSSASCACRPARPRWSCGPATRARGPPGYIHSVAHGEGAPAVSIHCYSPPLMKVGQYRVDAEGVLRRDAEHGRRELVDETIARVAPELV